MSRFVSLVALCLMCFAGMLLTGSLASGAQSLAKPTISSFTPKSGKVLASVAVTGKNLKGARSVKLAGASATFKVVSPTKVTFTVPKTAKTGKISITTAAGSVTSAASFTVLKTTQPTSGGASVGSASAGKVVFDNNCETCHGATGTGGNGGPDLTTMPLAQSEAGVIKQVTNGGGGMPPFGGQLTKTQIEDVAAFVTQDIVK